MSSKKLAIAILMAIAMPSLSSVSIPLARQSWAVAQSSSDSVNRRADDLLASANAKNLRNDSDASRLAQQAYELYKQSNNLQGQQQALQTLSWSYLIQNKLDSAISTAQQSLDLLPNSSQGVESASLLGLTYLFNDEPKKAVSAYQQGINIAQSTRNPYALSSAYQAIELAYTSLGQYQNSINSLNNAIQIDQQHGANAKPSSIILNRLGQIYYLQGNASKAEQTLSQALVQVQSESSELDINIPQQIEASINQAIQQMETLFGKNDPRVIQMREQLKKTYGAGQITDRIENSGDFKQLDLGRVLKGNEPHIQQICGTLQNIYASQNNTKSGIELTDQCQAQAFVRQLASKVTGNKLETVAPLTMPAIQDLAKKTKTTFVSYSIQTEDVIQAKDFQPRDTTLSIWVVDFKGQVSSRSVNLNSALPQTVRNLEELVAQSRQSIGVQGRASVVARPKPGSTRSNTQSLKQLYQILIKPIRDSLPNNPSDQVVFVPQGALASVPFPALIDSQGQYLIDAHTISLSPSIQAFKLTRQRQQSIRKSNQNALVVGNPKMPTYSGDPTQPPQVLAPLPGAEAEARSIASLLNVSPFIGGQATESSVTTKMKSASVIHLATHGLLDTPPRSLLGGMLQLFGNGFDGFSESFDGKLTAPGAIALTPGAGQDGLLTSDEIFALDLNADLVVLSACDTAQGTVTTDGVIGLTRSFMAAGAPSVVASLWKVSDAATVDLMTEFYQGLQQDMDKAQALRQAMLKARQKYPQPSEWAAFSVFGAV